VKQLRGQWRVIGRSSDGDELLLRPVSATTEVPTSYGLDGCLAVSTRQYGGDLGTTVAGLSVGNVVDAGLFPGRPGRFVDLTVTDETTLTLVHRTDRVPSVALDLWTETVEAAGDDRDESDAPLGASMPVETSDGDGEVHVLQSTLRRENDVWWSFVAGRGADGLFDGFEHLEGRPRDVVAANPDDRPCFYAFAFAAADSRAAADLRRRLGVDDGADTDVSLSTIREQFADGAPGATIHVSGP
jgi:hypothetical protein